MNFKTPDLTHRDQHKKIMKNMKNLKRIMYEKYPEQLAKYTEYTMNDPVALTRSKKLKKVVNYRLSKTTATV